MLNELISDMEICLPSRSRTRARVQMPTLKLALLILGVWASAIPTGAILTESPLNPHVNPTPLPSLPTSGVSLSLSADHEIAIFASSSQETTGTDELGSTRFKGKTNRSNNVVADYYKQDSFLPFSTSYPPPSPATTTTSTTTLTSPTHSPLKPYQALHFNGRFPSTNETLPFLSSASSSAVDSPEISSTMMTPTPSTTSLARILQEKAPGGRGEFISSPFHQHSSASSSSLSSSSSPSTSEFTHSFLSFPTTPAKRSVEEERKSITTFPDKPPLSSSPSTPSFTPSTMDVEAGSPDGKQSNINLLRKLWASTRSGKLNLTDEHRSLLRIESESATQSALSTMPSPMRVVVATLLSQDREKKEQTQNQVSSTKSSASTTQNSSRFPSSVLANTPAASAALFNGFSFTDPIEFDGDKGRGAGSGSERRDGDDLPEKSSSGSSSLSSTTIKPMPNVLSSLSPASFDMTSLPSSPSQAKPPPFHQLDHVKESDSNVQASLLSTTSNFPFSTSSSSSSSSDDAPKESPSREVQVTERKNVEDEGEEATVMTTKLAFPILDAGESDKENAIKLKDSTSSSSSSSSSLQTALETGKGSEKMSRHHLMLYPEWLSSGGVYPDDDTSAQQLSPSLGVGAVANNPSVYNGTGSASNNNNGADYYAEPEYDHLISGESGVGVGGNSVSHISSHLYNFAVPNRNLPPPPPPLTEEEDIRDEEEFKRYARLREKLADELLQDVVAAAGARRNWQSGRNNNNNRDQMMMMQEHPEDGGEEEAGERESRNVAAAPKQIGSSSSSSSGGGGDSIVSTESPQAIIAQQSGLADVISRGRIDSVMYVYFGDKLNDYHTEEIAGRVIQAIGGVIAAVAQVLTVLGAAKCVRRNAPTYTLPVHLHIGFALLISNLLLLLAVHATEPTDICATVAMILHYLHLVIGCWLFAHTVQTYRELRRHVESPGLLQDDAEDHVFGELPRRPTRPSILPYCFAAWSAPLPFILMSYLVNPDGYETRHYCWMSIEKGMVVSFIVPVFLLIGMNTFLVVLSLRHLLALRKLWHDSSGSSNDVLDEHSLDEKVIGSGIRASAMLLPLLAVMWFLEVVALENATSIFFQIAAAVANIALSWLVMYFLGNEIWPELWCQFSKASRTNSLLSMDDPCGGSSVQPSAAHLSFDNEPLLGGITPASTSSSTTPSFSKASSMLPSTSKSVTAANSTGSSGGSIITSSTAGPSSNVSTSSFSSVAKKSTNNNYPNSKGKSAPLSMLMPASGGHQQHHPLSAPSGGVPVSGKKSKSNGVLMKSKPNWSQPGGNEIYELKLDSISTICK